MVWKNGRLFFCLYLSPKVLFMIFELFRSYHTKGK